MEEFTNLTEPSTHASLPYDEDQRDYNYYISAYHDSSCGLL